MELWFSEKQTKNVKLSIRVERQLYSGQSEFQRIDVFESPEFGRFLTLDGYMMLTEKDEFIYHEMMVHIPMAVHPKVEKVLIIGAGDGGVIRELASYPEIRHMDLVEIDEMVVQVCKEYLPKTSCHLDDERVHIHYEDGLKYIRRCKNEYDLIIVDSTDPFGPGEGLFTREFYGNCYKALKEDGIMVNQHESPFYEEDARACQKAHRNITDGLHFHTLCEQGADALEITLQAVEEKFGKYLYRMKWLNLGGGHHITREDYDVSGLIAMIQRLRRKYEIEVYLEPGEAVVLNAGFLVSTVLETMKNGMDIAILDTSAACHMPDVLEMPYRPPVKNSAMPGEKPYTVRLAGPTCLAGDVIGDYSFDQPLKEGDQVVLEDMALYTMVKTNTFNGMPLPDLVWRDKKGVMSLVKRFAYEDFKGRLS